MNHDQTRRDAIEAIETGLVGIGLACHLFGYHPIFGRTSFDNEYGLLEPDEPPTKIPYFRVQTNIRGLTVATVLPTPLIHAHMVKMLTRLGKDCWGEAGWLAAMDQVEAAPVTVVAVDPGKTDGNL